MKQITEQCGCIFGRFFFLCEIVNRFSADLRMKHYCHYCLVYLEQNWISWITQERDWHMWCSSSSALLVQSDLVRSKNISTKMPSCELTFLHVAEVKSEFTAFFIHTYLLHSGPLHCTFRQCIFTDLVTGIGEIGQERSFKYFFFIFVF